MRLAQWPYVPVIDYRIPLAAENLSAANLACAAIPLLDLQLV